MPFAADKIDLDVAGRGFLGCLWLQHSLKPRTVSQNATCYLPGHRKQMSSSEHISVGSHMSIRVTFNALLLEIGLLLLYISIFCVEFSTSLKFSFL